MNEAMKKLHDAGQSIWIDNISRETLGDGSLERLISECSVTGLTSNPTIFEKAMSQGNAYDISIAELWEQGLGTEQMFFAMAIEDLRHAADFFLPIHRATRGVDGWVSLEISPLLANDAQGSIEAATSLHAQAMRENLFIKIPGTAEGLVTIEEAIYRGIPVNVTLLFSTEQYLAAAGAYLRGIERRLMDGKSAVVESVASVFVSRWDASVKDLVPSRFQNRLGIAMAQRSYAAYRRLLASDRWRRLADAGAHPQRLLWASTGTKDAAMSPTMYVEALVAPDTINTMPEKTLEAYAKQGQLRGVLDEDDRGTASVLESFREEGIDVDALAAQLQASAGAAFAASWAALFEGVEAKVRALAALRTAKATG